jgi:hypothetical protein
MMLIWKYQIPQAKLQEGVLQYVNMPRNATVLSCGIQHGLLTLWVDVISADSPAGYTDRIIAVVPTGQSINKKGRLIGRIDMFNGELVFHVFDLGET